MTTIKFTGDRLPAGSVTDRQVRYLPVTRTAEPPIQWNRYARNGKHPDAQCTNALHSAINSAAMYRTREVFNANGSIASPPGPVTSFGAGSRARYYFACETSPYTHALCAIVVMVPQDSGYDENAYAKLELATNAAGTPAVVTQTFEHGASPTGGTASGWPYVKMITKYVDVAPSTAYYCTFSDVDYGRILSATVFELSSFSENNGGYLAQNITSMTPVVDVFREKQATVLKNLWKKQGARVLSWTVSDGAPKTRVANTFLNLIDATSVAPSSSTPGYTLVMDNKDRLSQTTGVPCVMKVFGKSTAGGSGAGTLELCDSGGTAVATIAGGWPGAGTATWQSVAFNLPATTAKYDLRYKSDSVNTFSVYGVSVYEYET